MLWTQNENNILVAGHRGNPTQYPENTLISFQSAIDAGVDMIELDIQMTKDEQLVIIHNFTVDDTTNGTGYVRDMTLNELRALDAGIQHNGKYSGVKIPLFKEFLDLIKPYNNLLFDFELKEYPVHGNQERAYQTADTVISLIEEYNLADRCVLNAFSSKLLYYIHQKYNGRFKLHGYYPKSLLNPEPGHNPYDFLYCACVCEDFIRTTFDNLKNQGIDTWVGTRFKDRSSIQLAHECGATLITCDNPVEVLSILKDMGLHQ